MPADAAVDAPSDGTSIDAPMLAPGDAGIDAAAKP
jgi:hypothetical protein